MEGAICLFTPPSSAPSYSRIAKKVEWSDVGIVNVQSGYILENLLMRNRHACKMADLGVPDRYVDAFCGRVPKSVLARHYTDYSPQRLKRIYDRANLKVLS